MIPSLFRDASDADPIPPAARPGRIPEARCPECPRAVLRKTGCPGATARRWLDDMTALRTERLVLRRWQESDLEPWAAMNADPEVREHLGDLLTREQSDASVARFQAEFDERGYGWWAVEVLATGEF